MPEFTAKGNNKVSNKRLEQAKKKEIAVTVTLEEVLKSASEFFGFNMADYYAYIEHIKKTRHPDLFIAIRIAADYIKTYNPKKDPEELSQAEKNRLDKFTEEYIQAGGAKTETSKEFEALRTILPKTYYITNNKLDNEITKDFMDNGEIMLAVINPDKTNEISTYNSLTYEGENISITGKQTFTAYDRAVHNAVSTLWAAGNQIITPQRVYMTMAGIKEREYISPQAIGAVTKSIEKSRATKLKIDFTAEAKAKKLNVESAVIDSMLLNVDKITVRAGGEVKEAYKITRTPALYEYAQLTKQIISVPIGLLDIRQATRNTEYIIPIKEYLLRRIGIMKNNGGMGNKIVYNTIFEEAGIKTENPTQTKRYRDSIKAILDLWKKEKEIKGYKEYKDGKCIKGITITY